LQRIDRNGVLRGASFGLSCGVTKKIKQRILGQICRQSSPQLEE
jgi:hypothetical protein